MRELASTPQGLSSMSRSSREAARAYTFDAVADSYLDLFRARA